MFCQRQIAPCQMQKLQRQKTCYNKLMPWVNKPCKLLFTGPECSGKTTLSFWLSRQRNWFLVEEIAREYLTLNGPAYNQKDVFQMAELQWQAEVKAAYHFSPIICDTDQLTFLIWQMEKYFYRDTIAEERWMNTKPDVCFLCMPDVEWEYDPLRENPSDRDRLALVYEKELEKQGIEFIRIHGAKAQREEIINLTLKNRFDFFPM